MGFWRELSGTERRTFRACFGGWALDGMDFQLYSFVIPAVIAEWRLTKAQAGTKHMYRVIAVNTAGLKSTPSQIARIEP